MKNARGPQGCMLNIRCSPSEKGFTLLEVIFAISLLSIGLLAVASMQVAAITGNAYANRITEATAHAQDKLEELMSSAYTDAALSDGDHTETNPPAGYNITWEVDDNPGGVNNTKAVTVTVNSDNLRKEVSLTSVIIDPDA